MRSFPLLALLFIPSFAARINAGEQAPDHIREYIETTSRQMSAYNSQIEKHGVLKNESEDILPDKQIEDFIGALKNPDEKVQIRALDEIDSTLRDFDSVIASHTTTTYAPVSNYPSIKQDSTAGKYLNAAARLDAEISSATISLTESASQDIRLSALKILTHRKSFNTQRFVIEYVIKHKLDPEFCDALFTVDREPYRSRIISSALPEARRCAGYGKRTPEERKGLSGAIREVELRRAEDNAKSREWQSQQEERDTRRNRPVMYIIAALSLGSALFLTLKFPNFNLGERIAYSLLLGPAASCVFFIIFIVSTSPNDIGSIFLVPIVALPAFLISVFCTWQFVLAVEYIKKQFLSPGWWLFFAVITAINSYFCYVAVTKDSFFLKM